MHKNNLPNLNIENKYPNKIIAGIDEAGRGPLAGPVIAGAVILGRGKIPEGINDSKKLSAKKREYLYEQIIQNHIIGIGIADICEIDQYNILEATKLAMTRAFFNLKTMPDITLIDGNMVPSLITGEKHAIIKGDSLSLSIAAASIIAKVTRDKIMQDFATKYPNYGWERNSGYGTKYHLDAMNKYGITEFHRKSFAPVKNIAISC